MNLDTKIKELKNTALEECRHRGSHRWNKQYGYYETEEVSSGPCMFDPDDCGHTESVSHYKRTCVDCGTEETAKDQNLWLAKDGKKHWVCDPISGNTYFMDGPHINREELLTQCHQLLKNYSDLIDQKEDVQFLAAECIILDTCISKLAEIEHSWEVEG